MVLVIDTLDWRRCENVSTLVDLKPWRDILVVMVADEFLKSGTTVSVNLWNWDEADEMSMSAKMYSRQCFSVSPHSERLGAEGHAGDRQEKGLEPACWGGKECVALRQLIGSNIKDARCSRRT